MRWHMGCSVCQGDSGCLSWVAWSGGFPPRGVQDPSRGVQDFFRGVQDFFGGGQDLAVPCGSGFFRVVQSWGSGFVSWHGRRQTRPVRFRIVPCASPGGPGLVRIFARAQQDFRLARSGLRLADPTPQAFPACQAAWQQLGSASASSCPSRLSMAPFAVGTAVWYHATDGKKRAEVEAYDAGEAKYRVSIRNGWVLADKISAYSDDRKRQRVGGPQEPAAEAAQASTGNEGLSSASGGQPVAITASGDGGEGPSPSAGAQTSVNGGDGGLSPAHDDQSLMHTPFSTYASNAIAGLKGMGAAPWEAMQATFATDPDVLNKTLTAARAQVPFIHGEPGVCYAGFQPCP